MAVVFLEMDDGSADPWAVVDVHGPYGLGSTLWARFKPPDWIEFGTGGLYHTEGATRPPRNPDRRFRIRALERVLEGDLPRVEGGRFLPAKKRGATTVAYRTPCGEERVIGLSDLREIVEDAKGLMRDAG